MRAAAPGWHFAGAQIDGHAHELARQQHAVLVVEDGAGPDGAGLRVDPAVGEVEFARLGIDGAVRQPDVGAPVGGILGLNQSLFTEFSKLRRSCSE